MDNHDQRKTHTSGHEIHGVHVCHKCGWPFPNPHPSAKHRRAHKKICGTIEGYKLCVSEGQTCLNGSDDEHVSDNDHKTPGLTVSTPKAFDTGNNEKGNDGIGEKLIRSEDEVFSDAVADFSDSGQNAGLKERLQEDSLDSVSNVERVNVKDPEFSGSSEDNDFNDVSQLIIESTSDCQIQNPTILQSEKVAVGSTLELQSQLSGSTVDPLSSSIADLRTEELTVAHSDDAIGLSTDSHPSKSEAMPDVLPENKIYAGENVTDFSLTSVAKERNLKAKDEIKSDQDEVEVVAPSDNVVGEACEGECKIEVSDAVYSDQQVTDEAVNLKEKHSAEFLSVLVQDDLHLELNPVVITTASTNDVQVESAHVMQFTTSSDVNILQEKGEGNVNTDTPPTCDDRPDLAHPQIEYEDFKDHEGVVSQNPLGLHSSESLKHEEEDLKDAVTEENNSLFNPSHLIGKSDVLSSDVNILQEKGEGNVSNDTPPTCDDRPNLAHPQSEYEDVKDHEGVISQNPLSLHLSESLKHEEDDLKDTVTEENNSFFNPSQLTEKSDVLSPDMHVMDGSSSVKEELLNSEPMAEEMHAEEHTEVSPVKLTAESYPRIDEIGGSMNAVKTEMNERHMVHFSEEQGPIDVKNSQQISLPEGILMASSNDNPRDASLGPVISETTSLISIDNISHHEKNRTEINDVAVDGKGVGANVENDIGTKANDLQPNDLLQLEVKQSSDLFKSDDAGEMGKIEKSDIADAQCKERSIMRDTSSPKSASNLIESSVISESIIDVSMSKSKGIECTHICPLSGAQEDIKEDELNSNIKVHEECNRSVDTSADSHQAQDSELLVKAAEDLARKYTSLSSSTEATTQHDFAVEDYQDGEPGREGSGTMAAPVQDQSGNNLVKPNSSGTGIDASVDSGSRCDSLEANWGSVSVLSMQSDAPAVIDAETLPSTGWLASTEAGKSSLNHPKTASERQQSGKSEMFEPPSFKTLGEPGPMVRPKEAASEVQKGQNPQQPNSTSQAGWFPTLTKVINESQGQKKNEEIIAKVTNWSTSKEHTPLKSLLGEAAHGNKPKSPKLEENSVNQKNVKFPENNGAGLTTVNSILGPESPAAQALKVETAKEWNSPARYPADIKREKRKVKSRPYWIQLVCCSSVDPQRR